MSIHGTSAREMEAMQGGAEGELGGRISSRHGGRIPSGLMDLNGLEWDLMDFNGILMGF